MTVGIIGSRSLTDCSLEYILSFIPLNCSHIVSGGAVGIDNLAAQAAKTLGIKLTELLPDYSKYGKKAPIVRNHLIADQCDYLLAFWDGSSAGTRSVLLYCIEKNIPFRVILPHRSQQDTDI